MQVYVTAHMCAVITGYADYPYNKKIGYVRYFLESLRPGVCIHIYPCMCILLAQTVVSSSMLHGICT